MNQAEYRIIDKSRTGLHSKFCSLRNGQLQWYRSEALKHFGIKKLPKKNSDQIIQQILGKSPNDENKKLKDKTYYVANVVAYLNVINNLVTDDFIESFNSVSISDESLLVYNYHRIFQGLLFDSLILLNEYTQNILGGSCPYDCGKNYRQQNLTIYQSLRQSIFGQSSFHSFIDVEPDLSISIIRQLIELRVRRAIGVLGWYDKTSQSLEPLAMGLLFKVLGKYKDDIDLYIPFDCIVRIYGWSNIFLHTGIKDCMWKPIFVMEYLKEFALGKASSHNVNHGIAIKEGILSKIITDLESQHTTGANVIRCEPEAHFIKS